MKKSLDEGGPPLLLHPSLSLLLQQAPASSWLVVVLRVAVGLGVLVTVKSVAKPIAQVPATAYHPPTTYVQTAMPRPSLSPSSP